MTTPDATFAGAISAPRERVRDQARTITLPWPRLGLGGVLLLALVLNCWQLGRLDYGNTYYAAAVRSMMQSWHNFFFVSFDPSGFVTIDKPPLAFWLQTISAKLFGFNGISLLLPSILAGILSVLVLYHLVARVFGSGAGLLAALAMAVTPVAIATNRSNIVDSILVFFLLLAAWALSKAIERGSLRWLLVCAALVGLGFNVKMLEAYLVLPAFGLVYLLAAPRRWRVRGAHLVAATVVLLAVSLSWAVAVDLTPASQRPWVDSTTSNSEMDLALGYNGLERLLGMNGGSRGNNTVARQGQTQAAGTTSTTQNAAGTGTSQSSSSTQSAQSATGNTNLQSSTGTTGATAPGGSSTGARPSGAGGGGGMFGNGAVGPLRLIGQELGGQAGWLLPLAVLGFAVVATRKRIRLPLDREHAGTLLWGTWLFTAGAFFSVAGFFHSYYLVTIAPAIAALVGLGIVALWRDYQGRGWRGWLLPFALLATAAVQVNILQPYADWSRWLTPLVLTLTILGAGILIVGRLRRSVKIWAPVAAAVALMALLAAPTAWAAETTLNGGGGLVPAAGPSSSSGFGQGGGMPGAGRTGTAQGAVTGEIRQMNFGGTGGGGMGGETANSGLLTYLLKNQGSTKYMLVVSSSTTAASYIIQTGKSVMSLGGFGGNDPILTLSQLQALVKNNTVRYFYGVSGNGSSNSIGQWVQSSCKAVSATIYGGSSTAATTSTAGNGSAPAGGMPPTAESGTAGSQGQPAGTGMGNGGPLGNAGGFGGMGGGGFGNGQQLYDCSGAVK